MLRPQVESEGRLAEVLDNIELPLIKVLSRIERNGVAVDADLLHKQSQQLEKRIGELEREAFELAGREFNLGSPKQLGQILFEEQKIPVLKKTPKGAPSTAEGVLEELALDYPLPKVIMQHRGLAKLKSTYTDKLPRLLNKATGRVHTSYHQAVTATGRLSSSDPNLQNIPIRTEEGRKIRQAFIARPGYRIVAADYSQIELRIMAHLSEDKGLLEAFAEGRDIHTATAAEVFGTSLEKVSGDQRRSAKAINFGLIYGMSAWGCPASCISNVIRRKPTSTATLTAILAWPAIWSASVPRRRKMVLSKPCWVGGSTCRKSSRKTVTVAKVPSAPLLTHRCRAPRRISSSRR
ncbi:hypothetical protein HORIV_56770 [Vreelandella olivaria]|uniref:DNA-directed DNA polymerase n=1 Tax=Vreelandella olivaria TaxID=390919 RepID=A0ABN5X2E3_9GAMM|nr:hypothetical protein HORIV_56770 [Halomonas olivaria]